MDEIQKVLVKAGHKDLAQKYYELVKKSSLKIAQAQVNFKLLNDSKKELQKDLSGIDQEIKKAVVKLEKERKELQEYLDKVTKNIPLIKKNSQTAFDKIFDILNKQAITIAKPSISFSTYDSVFLRFNISASPSSIKDRDVVNILNKAGFKAREYAPLITVVLTGKNKFLK